MKFKLNRLGCVLGGISGVLILLISIVEFTFQNQPGIQATGWLFVFPILWNVPASLLLLPLTRLALPDWILAFFLILLGSLQWYFTGWLIEGIISFFKAKKRTR